MKTICSFFVWLWLVAICALGMLSALCGWDRLDRWCEQQLLDSDGQEEEMP